jgi:1,4-alpha-glucan branching enzyme
MSFRGDFIEPIPTEFPVISRRSKWDSNGTVLAFLARLLPENRIRVCIQIIFEEHFMATAEIVSNVAKTKHLGMGAIPHENGVAFRVWAPHAEAVHIAGTFNDWAEDAWPMEAEEHGHWYVDVPEARIGDEYKYLIQNGEQRIWRIDPRARDVTNSVGSSIVHDPHFDWEGDDYQLPPWNELVIYEMHIGTFHRTKDHPVGTFYHVLDKFDHLKSLGVNVLQLMPTAEFAGDFSWG